MKQLSIIIPMYNVEPYVERCLRSLENQNIPKDDYEIICINDGSPDNCINVVEKLQDEFNNIILINQENQGVSRARNNGLEIASGKYIMFIDPDDYVVNNTINLLFTNALHLNAQVAFLGYTYLHLDGSIHKTILNKDHENKLYSGIEAYYINRIDGDTDPDRMVAVLLEASFLKEHNLQYLSDVPYLEDGEFIARILCLAERCIFIGSPFYQRTTRLGSATNSSLFRTEKASSGFFRALCNLKLFQHAQKLSEKQKLFMNQPICKFLLLTLHAVENKPYWFNYKKTRRNLIKYGFKTLDLQGVVKPYIYYAFIYNTFPAFFYLNALLKEVKGIIKKWLNMSDKNLQFISDYKSCP